jgi:hypothetical protein
MVLVGDGHRLFVTLFGDAAAIPDPEPQFEAMARSTRKKCEAGERRSTCTKSRSTNRCSCTMLERRAGGSLPRGSHRRPPGSNALRSPRASRRTR